MATRACWGSRCAARITGLAMLLVITISAPLGVSTRRHSAKAAPGRCRCSTTKFA